MTQRRTFPSSRRHRRNSRHPLPSSRVRQLKYAAGNTPTPPYTPYPHPSTFASPHVYTRASFARPTTSVLVVTTLAPLLLHTIPVPSNVYHHRVVSQPLCKSHMPPYAILLDTSYQSVSISPLSIYLSRPPHCPSPHPDQLSVLQLLHHHSALLSTLMLVQPPHPVTHSRVSEPLLYAPSSRVFPPRRLSNASAAHLYIQHPPFVSANAPLSHL